MGYLRQQKLILAAGGMGESDKDRIVIARWLGLNIFIPAALMVCSWSAVIRIYQKWSKQKSVVNKQQGHVWPGLIDALGDCKRVCVVRTSRAFIAKLMQGLIKHSAPQCTILITFNNYFGHLILLRLTFIFSAFSRRFYPNWLTITTEA